jgi:hypothetical protein
MKLAYKNIKLTKEEHVRALKSAAIDIGLILTIITVAVFAIIVFSNV